MAKIQYEDPRNMRPATKALLGQILDVVEDYASQGYRLTLRQLYYQLVAADILSNEQQQYKKLGKILADARMCGMVDWDIIEDRLRVPQRPPHWGSVGELLDICADKYRCDRHSDQENYVEVWVEKDALSGVLLPITAAYHVNLMVNRGYSSISAMHDAAVRFMDTYHTDDEMYILYLGDHDPSGLDMVRDIADRLDRFGIHANVLPIALTMDQIERYDPPPNPAKVTDSRARDYIERYGHMSWELDALQPAVLHELLSSHLDELIDMEKYGERIEYERGQVQLIRKYAADSAGREGR